MFVPSSSTSGPADASPHGPSGVHAAARTSSYLMPSDWCRHITPTSRSSPPKKHSSADSSRIDSAICFAATAVKRLRRQYAATSKASEPPSLLAKVSTSEKPSVKVLTARSPSTTRAWATVPTE